MLSKSVEPPSSLVLIALLEERHDVPPNVSLDVKSREDKEHRFELTLIITREEGKFRPKESYTIDIGYMTAHSTWDKLIDALDGLFGMLIESGFDHRALPSGADVDHNGTKFDVGIKYERPDLDAAADRMLNGN